MLYPIQHIASVIHAEAAVTSEAAIEYLLIDSRKIVFPSASLFFALSGPRRDGHQYIKEIYERGVRSFVVNKNFDTTNYQGANFLKVDHVLQALQQVCAYHRNQFTIPVAGITGSNGKTIVKEWLNQLLQNDFNIVRSPRSFNSQVGVPLSVWQMNEKHTLGIFEAGISTMGEMEKLEKIIQPTIGILTNIGEAHNEGFESKEQKAKEKLQLFTHCNQLVYCKDSLPVDLINQNIELFSWSRKTEATVFITKEIRTATYTTIHFLYQHQPHCIEVPFTDAASIDNTITCCCVLLVMHYTVDVINQRIAQLQPVEMRMQLKKAINNCYVLNDSYSNDLASLSIALDYLKQQSGNQSTTVILSDILQSGLADEQLYALVAAELKQRAIVRLIGIGPQLSQQHLLFKEAVAQAAFYNTTENFLQQFTIHHFRDEFILLKGARAFEFERISKLLEHKVHQTILEINLSAVAHNLKEYQKYLLPTTKVMVMVKAFSYGSGSAEVARVLQFHKVDYLAVAYADEGVELRKAGISLPIMVMNIDEAGFDTLVEYNLEPEIYSFNIYHAFHLYLLQQGITQFPVHIKLDTGMKRLGFVLDDVHELFSLFTNNKTMVIRSIFSHLVGSESSIHDGFTKLQERDFVSFCFNAKLILGHSSFIKHIANSAGILRHPHLQYDMVRLGIGLYGVNSAKKYQLALETVATLKTTIAQIRSVWAGATIGYNRKGKVTRDSKIATIRIGYADGFSRRLGNGVGSVYVSGQMAPVIGSVCMDMTMIDVTDITGLKEGDEVEIFGRHIPVQQVAEWCGTIAYEIMTGISHRVKRVYVEE